MLIELNESKKIKRIGKFLDEKYLGSYELLLFFCEEKDEEFTKS